LDDDRQRENTQREDRELKREGEKTKLREDTEGKRDIEI
jgi:hypothetical protein